MTDPRRLLPSVGALLENDSVQVLLESAPRAAVTEAVRVAIDRARQDPDSAPRSADEWGQAVRGALADRERPSLRPVFNATGIVLHTNLGRAPLPDAALAAIREVGAGYSNLEYDLARGERGSRYAHSVAALCELTDAEDAIVVNNCAAALVLALNTLADGRDAIVSRGELIEIGGGFRVPDIMAKSGTHLVEVGTTNRTRVADYVAAITEQTAAIVKVHLSNFAMAGFVADVPLAELAVVGRERGLAVLYDFGSGLLINLDAYGLGGEPTARDAVRAGATLVVMSGDKLLGGPQAGIVVGSRGAVASLRANPLTRALRVDKLTISALGATLALYRDHTRAITDVPALAMLTAPVARVRARAERLRDRLATHGIDSSVTDTEAGVGGGAFPTARIPSAAVAVGASHAEATERRLRDARTPVVARTAGGVVLLDLRSIPERDDEALAETVLTALS
jgi:L-seryl-tRNA(Ser) seleniumtransferase